MITINKQAFEATAIATGVGLLVLVGPLSAERWTSVCWAQENAGFEPQQIALRRISRHRDTQRRPPQTKEETSEEVAKRLLDVPPASEAGGALAAALASCDKDSSKTESLTLPGAKGEVKLDGCYRGRSQFVCGLNTLFNETKALSGEFANVIDANYPQVANVDGICRITPDALSADLAKTGTFDARFKDLRNEFDRHINCAMKIDQNLKQVSLADMPRATDILKSLSDTIEGDMKDVAGARQQIFDLNKKVHASQRAIVSIETLRQVICLSTLAPKPVDGVEKKPFGGGGRTTLTPPGASENR